MANKIMRSTLAGVLAVLSVAAYVPGTAVSTFFADTAITASASSVYGDFTYDELASGSLSITKYSGHDTKVTIPSEINGKTVTEIGANAFIKNTDMTDVTIPNTVTNIGDFAFCGCSKLKKVIIPNSITSMGRGAFAGCMELAGLYLSSSLTEIPEGAFQRCASLQTVTIPENVTSIGNYAFQECSTLARATLHSGVSSIGKKAFYGCENLLGMVLPEKVTEIPEYAFFGCKKLDKVYFREGLTAIGDSAFGSCESLPSVDLPSTLTSIGSDAFANCKKLSAVTIPDSVTALGKQAFTNCHGLTEVKLSKNLKTIPQGAFILTGITSIEIPEGVDTIENLAFYSCKSLTDVSLPSTLSTCGVKMFELCADLKVKFAGTEAQWNAIDLGETNDKLKNASITFAGASAAPKISFQSSEHSVKLTWTAVNGAEKYAVAGYSNGKWQLLAQTQNTSYVLEGLKAGTDYKIAVVAKIGGEWKMDTSNAVTVALKSSSNVTCPTNIKVEYNEKDHRMRFSWDKVAGAEKYGIAVYQAGMWRIQVPGITANTYTTPKGMTPGKTYKVAIAAKVNGKWDTNNAIRHAVTVTVK